MKKNKSFLFGLIITIVMAMIPIAYSVYCKFNSYLISYTMVMILIVPFMLSLVTVLIKKIPHIIKIILPVLMLIVSVFSLWYLTGVGGHEEFRAFDNENEIIAYYSDFDTERYGKFKNISYYKYHSTGIFQYEAYTTILKYDEENFIKEKRNIADNYEFYSEPIEKDEPIPIFNHDGFDFCVEISGSPQKWYPKQLHLIGISEESREIVYVSFENDDLDMVSDFGNFLDFYCGWTFIAKERTLHTD